MKNKILQLKTAQNVKIILRPNIVFFGEMAQNIKICTKSLMIASFCGYWYKWTSEPECVLNQI